MEIEFTDKDCGNKHGQAGQAGKATGSGNKDNEETDPETLPCFLHQGKHTLAQCFVFQKVKPKIKKELIADALVEAKKNNQKDNPPENKK